MGMGFRKKRAKAFKQHTDRSRDEMGQPTLSALAPVQTDLTYECVREPEDSAVEVGDKVRLIDAGDRVDVYERCVVVGHLLGSQVESLRRATGIAERIGRSLFAVVIEMSSLTPMFVIRIGT